MDHRCNLHAIGADQNPHLQSCRVLHIGSTVSIKAVAILSLTFCTRCVKMGRLLLKMLCIQAMKWLIHAAANPKHIFQSADTKPY